MPEAGLGPPALVPAPAERSSGNSSSRNGGLDFFFFFNDDGGRRGRLPAVAGAADAARACRRRRHHRGLGRAGRRPGRCQGPRGSEVVCRGLRRHRAFACCFEQQDSDDCEGRGGGAGQGGGGKGGEGEEPAGVVGVAARERVVEEGRQEAREREKPQAAVVLSLEVLNAPSPPPPGGSGILFPIFFK